MKKLLSLTTVMTLCCFLMSLTLFAQPRREGSPNARKLYMMANYGLTPDQVNKYETDLARYKAKMAVLQNKTISSQEYDAESKALFKEFQTVVSANLTPSQFSTWLTNTRSYEYVRAYEEDWQVPVSKMLLVRDAEVEAYNKKKAPANTSDQIKSKCYTEVDATNDKHTKILGILGETMGRVYITELSLQWSRGRNMDKYKVPCSIAYTIARIEKEYANKQTDLKAIKTIVGDELREALDRIEKDKVKALNGALPKNVMDRWVAYNDNKLDNELSTTYKLTKAQIAQYKDSYNKFAISEYLINRSKAPAAEKHPKLEAAHNTFCESVKSLFAPTVYQQWHGRRLYDYEQVLKRRKIIK